MDSTSTRIANLSSVQRQVLSERLLAAATAVKDVAIVGGACLHELIEEQVERTPAAVALRFEEVELSYRELDERANQLAHYLRGLGVGPEVVVGICMERSVEMVVGLLGILKAGGAYLPLDPSYPSERLNYMLTDAGVSLLLTQGKSADGLSGEWNTLRVDDEWSVIAQAPRTKVESGVTADNLAYVIYTSGSTGRPKGSMLQHRGICNRLQWMQETYGLSAADAVLQKTSFSFDVSVWEFFWPLMTGARLVLAQPDGHRDTAYLTEVIKDQRITVVHFVPSMLQAWLASRAAPTNDAAELRLVVCSGEALSAELQRRFVERLPWVELENLYGPTEASVDVTRWRCGKEAAAVVPIGHPVWNTQMYVLGRELELLPVGVVGELYIGGVQLARGYAGRPELTAERFIPHPHSSEAGARLYRTGDLGRYLANGAIEYVGRTDDQVKIRGFRIELGEVEAALLAEAEISECVVLARDDEAGQKRLVAYVVAEELDERAIRDGLQARLPDYMVPAAFVKLERLPLSVNGKLERRALPAPDWKRLGLRREFVPARTAAEAELARIWCEVLGLERVGMQDNFFELGGDSILSLQIIARAAAAGLRVTAKQLFQQQTIAGLAQVADQAIKRQEREQEGEFPLARLSQSELEHLVVDKQAIEDIYPTTPLQQGLLFQSLYAPNAGFYHQQVSCRLSDEFDSARFVAAWQRVIACHAIFRTGFVWEGLATPLQVVYRRAELPVEEHDWRELSPVVQAERWAQLQREDRTRGFKLETAPLMRLVLARLSETDYQLLWSHHHLLLDGWCLALVMKEVFAAYAGVDNARGDSRPYRDYIAWLQEQDLDAAEKYWRQALSGFSEPTSLRLARPKELPAGEALYRKQRLSLREDQLATLQERARSEQVTMSTVLQGAWALLLFRYSGTDDVVFGVTVSGRPAELRGVEQMIGLFINTLPLRTKMPANDDVWSWLRELQTEQLDTRQYEYSPLAQVQQWSELAAGQALFETLLAYENYPVERSMQTAKLVSKVDVWERTNYPLTIVVMPGEEFVIELRYDREYYDDESVERLGTHLLTILKEIPSKDRVAAIEILNTDERRQLAEWNSTAAEFSSHACLHELIEEQVERTPAAVALRFEDVELSYRELDKRANQLAHYLRDLGVGPEAVVGICMERSVEMVVGLLGILKAGGAYLPLDPSYPADRLNYMLSDAGVSLLLTQGKSAEGLHGEWETLRVDDEWSVISQAPRTKVESGVTADNLAYVIYTSGSTGRPKGSMLQHRGICNRLQWMQETYGLSAADAVLQKTSFSFDVSVWEFFWPLMTGARLVLAQPEGHRDTAYLTEVIKDQRITVVHFVPSMLQAWLTSRAAPTNDAAELRLVVCSGEALSAELQRRFVERLPWVELENLYGPTEASVDVTRWRCGKEAQAVVPIGHPVWNTQMYVLGRELELLPVGVVGELYIGGVQLARGYAGRPELTAERFIPHPHSSEAGARLYRTGDLGRYLANGAIEYVGRTDDQVKIRGFRIELGEVEAALLAEAEISECVVLARDDEAGQKRLVAYVVAEELDERAIRDGLQARLPDYMVPAAFVRLERLPLSVNGKLERRALPEPDWKRLGLRREFVAARTAAEAELARIWCEVLGLERVGMQDNFFELGGDSILSLQIIARAAAAGLRVTAKQLFQQPTIAALVQVAEGEVSTGRDWTEQGTVSGPAGLTPIQRWFFAQEREKPEHFNQAMMLRVSADLQAKYLREAVRALLDHHDALRMRFRKDEEGKWEQYNEPVRQQRAACAPEVHEVEVIGEAYTTVAEQIQRSLSLSDGPMLRVVLMRSDATEARLLLVLHHLVVDGVSWRILLQDLQTAYEQLSRGDSLRLPAKTNSYQQWSTRLQDYAASAQLANDAAYWREQPWERATQLRLDHEDGRNQRQDAQQVTIELGREQTRRLLQEAPKTYRTGIQELLLTAFASVLSEWNESEAVLLELEGHGREESIADVTRTVGWFTTLYPVLLQVERGAGTGERIKSVKEQLRAVPTGGLAYGVQRYLSDKANPRLPQAEIVFNYLGQLDHVLTENGLIHGVASESTGSSEDPNAARPWLLEINGEVVGGQLRLRWSYSAKQFERQTIERVAQQYQTELEALIEHCCDSAGGRTPSDYPLARLKQAEVDHLAGDGREVEDIYPTTPLQQGLLFQSLYAPSAGFYHQQVSCRLSGDFESGRFVQAWHKVITRHAIFRTGFVWEGLAAPLQIVYRATELPVDEHDWRTLSSSEQATRWDELRREDRKRGFRLETAPLMRLVLARVSETEYRLLWSHHHLLLDGWCLALVMDEVFAAYDGQVDAVTVNRPYRDYIAWLQEQDLDAAEKYWRHTLSDFTEPTLVLERRGRGARQNEQGQRWVRLTAEQTQRLQERARREQVTMNTVLQGAWALLLSRYSGTSDVVFGTTVSGRPAKLASVEQMIGLFINTLPVRIRIPVNQPVWDWLRELQTEQLEMLQYEYSPLAQVQQWSEVAAGKSLFETLLAYENYPIEQSMRAGHHTNLQVKDVDVWERSNYPLAVVVMPGVELAIEMTYERERFDDESIAQLGAHLLTLLEEIETKGNVADVAMLKADERRQLREWNETTVDYPHHLCIHELFTAQVKQTPDAVAVSYEGKQLTYHELNQHSDQLAIRLKSLGVGPGVLVGVFMKHSPEEIAALLAILKSGGAYVPLEPAHPPARVAFIINDAQLSLILTQQEMHGRLPETKVSAICVDVEEQPDAPESFKSNSTPGDIAYVIYTSGSTGEPKGASISYRALVNYAWWAKHVYVQDETAGFALYSSLAFDLTVTSIYVPLISGGKIVIHEWEGSEARKEAPLAKILADGETTVLKLTPSHLSLIKDWDNRQTTVKRLIVGGEALTGELALETYESFGGHVEICNEYGPTEATVGCMLHIFDPQTEAMSDVPIGRPAANVQIYVLDDRLEPTAAGVNGELYIAGDGLAQGYLNRPDLTAARFIPNPFKPGKRMYRSGDLARRLSNGILEYLGRQDDQIKFHGYRVELNEIRATLKRHPQVRDSVVLITQDKNGSDVMVAYYVSRHELEAIELRTFLSNFLIAETIPNIFVRLARVPLTVNGKINYQALPSLDEAKQSLKRSYERARTTPEEILAGVWGEVLSLERVGIHDNFFDLGGHSLLATQLISRIREAFSVEIALRTLFEKPTVAGMATAIEERLRAGQEVELPPLEPASRDNSLPLSFSQQRLWFMDQLQPGSAFYNSALAVRLTGQLKKDVLDRTLSEIVRRHESLRTTFENSGAGPVQIIAAPAAQKIPLIDLSGLAAESSNAERQRLSNEEAAAPFDLSKGPLLRVLLLRTAVTEHVVLLTMHHIISDGWSMEVLVKEVAELYRAYSEHFSGPQASSPASLSTEEQTKTPAVLSELQVQYADFAIWQRSWLQGDTLGRELDYWKRRLAGAPATTEFPTDRPRPAVQTHNGARASFTIPESLVESLKRFSRERNATLFMTLLTAFNVLLHRYSGQDDLVIGTPLAGRNRPELENLIGIFINNLVLRTDLSGDPTFIELLSKVREGFLEAYAHQDVPFEKLVEELQVNRDPGRSPLFQVPFGFQPLPGQKFKLPGLELEPLSIENETARFDLTVWIFETANGLNASWTYNTDLFYESTIKRLHGQFETLLVNILKQPEARLSSFEMLSESEQREREDQEAQQQATALDKLMKARRKSVPLSA